LTAWKFSRTVVVSRKGYLPIPWKIRQMMAGGKDHETRGWMGPVPVGIIHTLFCIQKYAQARTCTPQKNSQSVVLMVMSVPAARDCIVTPSLSRYGRSRSRLV